MSDISELVDYVMHRLVDDSLRVASELGEDAVAVMQGYMLSFIREMIKEFDRKWFHYIRRKSRRR